MQIVSIIIIVCASLLIVLPYESKLSVVEITKASDACRNDSGLSNYVTRTTYNCIDTIAQCGNGAQYKVSE